MPTIEIKSEEYGLWSQVAWIQVLVCSANTTYVNLAKMLNFFCLSFHFSKMEIIIQIHSSVVKGK